MMEEMGDLAALSHPLSGSRPFPLIDRAEIDHCWEALGKLPT
jgi:hypothetical protein